MYVHTVCTWELVPSRSMAWAARAVCALPACANVPSRASHERSSRTPTRHYDSLLRTSILTSSSSSSVLCFCFCFCFFFILCPFAASPPQLAIPPVTPSLHFCAPPSGRPLTVRVQPGRVQTPPPGHRHENDGATSPQARSLINPPTAAYYPPLFPVNRR